MPLAEFFREIANKELECKVSGFSSEARKALLTHSWPGNVRELRQKIMGAVLQAQTGPVTKDHLELGITETTSVTGFSLRNDEEDKERILRALKQADGNRKVAAELLGIGRTTLYNKLEEYGLKYKFLRFNTKEDDPFEECIPVFTAYGQQFIAYLQTVPDQCLHMSEVYDAGITSGRPAPPWQAASYNKLVTADAGMDSFEKANIFLPRSFSEAPMCQTSALPVAADLQSGSAPSIIMKRS